MGVADLSGSFDTRNYTGGVARVEAAKTDH